ncbi:uncharacterized protein PSFLO_07418 [Pseudozyma flocculosa]|uniref:Uncharacterized protein n=1 Tax=Pseudozyma flocculosa TaxID=84751 RepID=A0A5C3FE22_9BASI|nr:uncharacterized protein PSFLO_07418 [Pseudozyma flocculosa]
MARYLRQPAFFFLLVLLACALAGSAFGRAIPPNDRTGRERRGNCCARPAVLNLADDDEDGVAMPRQRLSTDSSSPPMSSPSTSTSSTSSLFDFQHQAYPPPPPPASPAPSEDGEVGQHAALHRTGTSPSFADVPGAPGRDEARTWHLGASSSSSRLQLKDLGPMGQAQEPRPPALPAGAEDRGEDLGLDAVALRFAERRGPHLPPPGMPSERIVEVLEESVRYLPHPHLA